MEGRKVYRLTAAGRQELDSRRAELEDLQARATDAARKVAGMIGGEMRGSVRDLREELRHQMKDIRREDRYASRSARRRSWSGGADGTAGGRSETRREGLGWRVLKDDLDAFRDDILDAARELDLDRGLLASVRERLMEAKDRVVEHLGSQRRASEGDSSEV
jgi:hypothetical protein